MSPTFSHTSGYCERLRKSKEMLSAVVSVPAKRKLTALSSSSASVNSKPCASQPSISRRSMLWGGVPPASTRGRYMFR